MSSKRNSNLLPGKKGNSKRNNKVNCFSLHRSLRSVVISMKMPLEEIPRFLLSSPCIWSVDHKYEQKNIFFYPPTLTEGFFIFLFYDRKWKEPQKQEVLEAGWTSGLRKTMLCSKGRKSQPVGLAPGSRLLDLSPVVTSGTQSC